MAVSDDIIRERACGIVHCALSSRPSQTVPELAREFGLRDDPACYKAIDEHAAHRLVRLILHKDLAYQAEVMPEARAVELANLFLQQFGSGARYYTNGTFHEERRQVSEAVWSGASWDPVTQATFDTGVLVIAPRCSGCLWVEDED
jgi:hypothetical protein